MNSQEHLRIVFFGTASFGVPSLTVLLNAQYPVVAVVTAEDKPAGRGRHLAYSPVKQYALERRLPVLQPRSLKDAEFTGQLVSLMPDIFVVVAFRILPVEVFTIPRLGSFNLHASLLPRYRGAAPINWAVIRGEAETGVTTFFLQEKVDTGGIILQARTPVGTDETAGQLHDRLAEMGAGLVLDTVRLIGSGNAAGRPQNGASATTAPKLSKEDCRIDWGKTAREVHDFVRGLSPKPCAFTFHHETLLKIYRARVAPAKSGGSPGEVFVSDDRLFVSARDGDLEILEMQQEGKRRLSAGEFLRGYGIRSRDRFS